MTHQASVPPCPLCNTSASDTDVLITKTPYGRIIRTLDTPYYPAFYRFIWYRHVAEFSELNPTERQACMETVFGIEQAMTSELSDMDEALKINLASLGNMVPHLHWHIVARFSSDPHFPKPIWADLEPAAVWSSKKQFFLDGFLPKITAKLPRIDAKIKMLVHSIST